MKKKCPIALALFLATFVVFTAQAKIKIACVGNSITVGYLSYPTSLGSLLGDDYEVGNFGNWGHSLSDNNKDSYMSKQPFTDAQNFNPDIVTIKLGSNDSKSDIWNDSTYEADLRKMIDIFQSLPSHPRIILCTPIPAYNNIYGIRDNIIKVNITNILKKVAAEKNFTLVDLHTCIDTLPLAFRKSLYGPDNVHPTYTGGYEIAKGLYPGITGKPFYMKPGGVSIPVAADPVAGQKLSLGTVHFGSKPSYHKIQVNAELESMVGSFDFYLDDSIQAFASINLTAQSLDSTSFRCVFPQNITNEHQVSVVWNGQSTRLSSVSIQEEYKPFVPVAGKKYLIINKYNGLAIQRSGTGVYLNKPDGTNVDQQYTFNLFNYGVYFIKNQGNGYNMYQTYTGVGFINGGEDKGTCSMNFPAKGEGAYLLGTSASRRIGKANATSNMLYSNHSEASLNEWDKWTFVESTKVVNDLKQVATPAMKAYGQTGMILVSNLVNGQQVSVYNLNGLLVQSVQAGQTTLEIPVKKGIYLVKVSGDSIDHAQKAVVN